MRVYLPALTFFSATTKATVFDPHGTELSGERGTSTAFSGEGERHHRESSYVALFKGVFTNKESVVILVIVSYSSLSF